MTWVIFNKDNWRPLWANRWWIVALTIAWIGYWNALLNSGYVFVQTRNARYWYYFGGDSAVWGLVTGILVAVLYSKVKATVQRTKLPLPQKPAIDTEP